MSKTTKKASKKVFDRQTFEQIKKLQTRGLSRDLIMDRVGFGQETVRKAMRAPNWPQYRKNEIKGLKARKARRYKAPEQYGDAIFGEDDNLKPYIPLKTEGQFSEGFQPKDVSYTRSYVVLGAIVFVVALVLFLVLR